MATEVNNEEKYFEWWLDDLKSFGLVLQYFREPETFVIRDAMPIYFNEYNKKGESKIKNKNLFPAVHYTPDYCVYFSMEMLNKFIGFIKIQKPLELEDFQEKTFGNPYDATLHYTSNTVEINGKKYLKVYYDVKPPNNALRGGKTTSSISFPLKQRMILESKGIYINKAITVGSAQCLFEKTFTPKRYLYTDGGTMLRKIKHTVKSIESFFKNRNIKFQATVK